MHHDEKHTPFERRCLIIRNILVSVSAILFLVSLIPTPEIEALHHDLTGIAYIIGALAYLSELVEEADEQKQSDPHHKHRLFMPNVFGILYIILGISHFLE